MVLTQLSSQPQSLEHREEAFPTEDEALAVKLAQRPPHSCPRARDMPQGDVANYRKCDMYLMESCLIRLY